jgi:hypothetical protein
MGFGFNTEILGVLHTANYCPRLQGLYTQDTKGAKS